VGSLIPNTTPGENISGISTGPLFCVPSTESGGTVSSRGDFIPPFVSRSGRRAIIFKFKNVVIIIKAQFRRQIVIY
jgi:hypothetical protein